MAEAEPLQAEVNIGMVGHVDHGKTSLTEQLTGKWTDTHSEELKRGISIRLGYADVVFRKCEKCPKPVAYTTKKKCPVCGGDTKILRRASFVDAPGHETLMTTMLSGAALMNGAILVVAANEPCPQPRTEEHLMALRLSCVENIVVAQNKVDLVDREKAVQNYKEIIEFLKHYGCENAAVIPTAAPFGANIDLLIEAIEEKIPSPSFSRNKPLKMFVARSFDINKPGTKPEELKGGVIGGSITEGTVKKGDLIEIGPGLDGKKLETKVESLSTEGNMLEEAFPGGLIAICTTLDPGLTRNDQMRGQVVCALGKLVQPARRLKLEIHMLKRLISVKPRQFKQNELVVLTIGTMTVVGTVVGMGKGTIDVELKSQVVAEKGQKLALSLKEGTSWRLVAYGTNL